MKTPIKFEYDLWTTEDGKCMVRVKATGEVTEVDREVMRLLRAEEKRLRREIQAEQDNGVELSLDVLPDSETGESWLADAHDPMSEVDISMLEQAFLMTLTEREKDVYRFCIKSGHSQQAYVETSGLSVSRVSKIISAIRKKAKIFFEGCQVFAKKCPLGK